MKMHPTIDRLFNEMWDGHNSAVADELFADEFLVEYGDDSVSSIDDFKGLLDAWFAGIPDIKHDVKDCIENGNVIVTRWSGNGTHDGEFCEIPATGKPFHYSGITIFHLDDDGKITKAWVGTDFNGQVAMLRE